MKKSRMKQVISLVLVFLLSVTIIAGCRKQQEQKPGDSTAAPATSTTSSGDGVEEENKAYFPLKEPIELSVAILDFGRERNTRIDEEIEKRTNIKFKWQIIPGNYAEKINTMLAAGEVPDIIPMCQPELLKYQEQGLFIDFSKYIDKMPNLQRWGARFSDMLNYFKTANGNLYALNVLNTEGGVGLAYIYRSDILKKNNLQLPVTTTDMIDVFKKLKALYPESYPFYSDLWAMTTGMYYLYHTDETIFFDTDTLQYRYGPEMSNFMDALRFSRKLYADNLVNPDFAVATPEQILAQYNAGKGFCWYYWIGSVASDISDGQKVDPDFKLEAALPPITETGLQGRTPIYYATNNWWCITGNAKGKYVEQVIQFLDYQMSDEFVNLINWGYEGETYTEKDGHKEFIIGQDAVKGMGLDGRSGVFAPMDPNVGRVTAKNKEIINIFNLYNSNVDKIGIAKPPVIATPEDFNTKRGQVMTRIDTAMKEAALKFITGKITEEEMQKVIKDIMDKGEYKEFVDRLNQEFEKIKGSYKLDFNIK